jgi:DNA-binding PadR family transcriptional regulator
MKKVLTIFEQIILASILILKDDAFGITIRKKAQQLTGKNIMYGALYNVLDQLHRKGYVTKTKKKPVPSEGHTRIYYTLTSEGMEALQEAYSMQKSIWDQLPEVIKGT